MPQTSISESQFYMWRTLFALAHVDHVVTGEELRFMIEVLEDLPFSEEQRQILNADIKTPQSPAAMFVKITNPGDRAAFFKFAHDMVWIDGVFGKEEQAIMLELQKKHVRSTDVDELVGKINLKLEGEDDFSVESRPRYRKDAKRIIHSFRERFLRSLSG